MRAAPKQDFSLRPFGLEAPRVKRSKYNVDLSPAGIAKRTVDGIVFDSVAEARRYCELKLLQRGGYIRNLKLQPRFKFEIEGKLMFTYVSDFAYFEGSLRVVEDCKGVQTDVFRLKHKIIEAHFNIKITVVS